LKKDLLTEENKTEMKSLLNAIRKSSKIVIVLVFIPWLPAALFEA